MKKYIILGESDDPKIGGFAIPITSEIDLTKDKAKEIINTQKDKLSGNLELIDIIENTNQK